MDPVALHPPGGDHEGCGSPDGDRRARHQVPDREPRPVDPEVLGRPGPSEICLRDDSDDGARDIHDRQAVAPCFEERIREPFMVGRAAEAQPALIQGVERLATCRPMQSDVRHACGCRLDFLLVAGVLVVREQLPEGTYLDLHVKVERRWQNREEMLDRLGY